MSASPPALPGLMADLGADRWADAAAAIMTTDTFPKLATRTARIGRVEVRINGIAKGSGMIAPDMATMLAFVATDAKLPASVLRSAAAPGGRAVLQLHHRGWRHLHQRHAAAGGDRRGPSACHGSPAAGDRRLADFSRQAGGSADRSRLPGGARRRRGEQIRHHRRDGRGLRRRRPADRAGDRQFAPGQDRHRRRRRQLGPHRHGGGQGRREGRARQAEDLHRWREGGRPGPARAGLRRSAGRRPYEGPRDRHCRRCRGRPRHAPGSGPAI